MNQLVNNFNSLASVSQATVTVGTASSTILAANANRTYAILVNYGTVNVTLGIEAAAVLNKGIVLPAGGGFYEMSVQYGNNVRGLVTAIADTTVTSISYLASGGGR